MRLSIRVALFLFLASTIVSVVFPQKAKEIEWIPEITWRENAKTVVEEMSKCSRIEVQEEVDYDSTLGVITRYFSGGTFLQEKEVRTWMFSFIDDKLFRVTVMSRCAKTFAAEMMEWYVDLISKKYGSPASGKPPSLEAMNTMLEKGKGFAVRWQRPLTSFQLGVVVLNEEDTSLLLILTDGELREVEKAREKRYQQKDPY